MTVLPDHEDLSPFVTHYGIFAATDAGIDPDGAIVGIPAAAF